MRQSRARSRRLAVGLFLVVVAAAGIATIVFLSRKSDGLGDPAKVALPASPSDPAPTVEFLVGEGVGLVQVHRMLVPLVDRSTSPAECRSLALEQLPTVGEPPALFDLATRIPDRDTSALVQAELGSLVDYLGRCTREESASEREFAFNVIVTDRRLRQLGVLQ